MDFSGALLTWYDVNKRVLPFRGTKDAYRVWLSEIMLQQTRTETVGAYYERFIAQFPDVFALSRASEQEVLKCWEGLGYYSRARNLLKCARQVVQDYGGAFPKTARELKTLPGIGDYTAAAVASIAFGECVPALDGNLVRVLSRTMGVRENAATPSIRRVLYEGARERMPISRAGEFNQALMDIGATICTPGTPNCDACPLSDFCDAYQAGDADMLPVLPQKTPQKHEDLSVLVVRFVDKIYLEKREQALLKGLYVYILADKGQEQAALEKRGIDAKKTKKLCQAKHVFTHRVWHMQVYLYTAKSVSAKAQAHLYDKQERLALPMPTAMRAAHEAAEAL